MNTLTRALSWFLGFFGVSWPTRRELPPPPEGELRIYENPGLAYASPRAVRFHDPQASDNGHHIRDRISREDESVRQRTSVSGEIQTKSVPKKKKRVPAGPKKTHLSSKQSRGRTKAKAAKAARKRNR